MSLAIWSDLLNICNDPSTVSTNKRMKIRGIPLKHLLQLQKEDVEELEVIEDWPNKFEEQMILHR